MAATDHKPQQPWEDVLSLSPTCWAWDLGWGQRHELMLMEPKELPSGGQVAASAGPQVLLEGLLFPGTARPWGPGDQDLGRGTPTPSLGWETTCLGSSWDSGHGWMPVVPELRVGLEEKPEMTQDGHWLLCLGDEPPRAAPRDWDRAGGGSRDYGWCLGSGGPAENYICVPV